MFLPAIGCPLAPLTASGSILIGLATTATVAAIVTTEQLGIKLQLNIIKMRRNPELAEGIKASWSLPV